jgi:phage shock protein E
MQGGHMKPSLILDVRSSQEFSTGHLEGAVNIPHDQLQQRIDSIAGLEKTSPVLVYCRSGVRSAIACSILVQQGFTQVMNGGSMTTLLMNYKGTAATMP